jgi:MORN repeat
MKKSTTILVSLLFSSYIFAQNCAVETASLKGIYTGDCKKGKANGKGKAVGTDTYEGDFKAGLPEGNGTYVWKNGNRFTGEFVSGLKDGKGIMLYKKQDAKDSIVEGYWKKDVYTGKDESPYKLIFKSKLVTDLETEFKEDRFHRISFFITNTSGGGVFVDGTEMTRMKVDEVQIVSGSYGRLFINDNHAKKTESVLEDVIYPIRFKAIIGEEQVEMEFKKPGSYVITLRIND